MVFFSNFFRTYISTSEAVRLEWNRIYVQSPVKGDVNLLCQFGWMFTIWVVHISRKLLLLAFAPLQCPLLTLISSLLVAHVNWHLIIITNSKIHWEAKLGFAIIRVCIWLLLQQIQKNRWILLNIQPYKLIMLQTWDEHPLKQALRHLSALYFESPLIELITTRVSSQHLYIDLLWLHYQLDSYMQFLNPLGWLPQFLHALGHMKRNVVPSHSSGDPCYWMGEQLLGSSCIQNWYGRQIQLKRMLGCQNPNALSKRTNMIKKQHRNLHFGWTCLFCYPALSL